MYYMLLVLTVLLSACHRPRCDEADYETEGLCVILNGREPNREQINYAVLQTGILFNDRGVDDRLSITDFLSDHEASVKYIHGPDTEDDGNDKGLELAETNNSNIDIAWNHVHLDRDERANCRMHVAVMAHEIMHIIAEYHMGIGYFNWKGHDVPGLFTPEKCGPWWDVPNTSTCRENVEHDMWVDLQEYCLSMYP